MCPPLSSAEPPVIGKYVFFYFSDLFLRQTCVYVHIMLMVFLFVFVLCCAEKEEGGTGVVID